MAGSIPYTRINIENTAIDAASYVATNWMAMGDLNQMFSRLEYVLSIATTAILYKVLSTTDGATGIFATTAINLGVTIPVDKEHGFYSYLKASTYMNFQFSATTTIEEFFGVEIQRW